MSRYRIPDRRTSTVIHTHHIIDYQAIGTNALRKDLIQKPSTTRYRPDHQLLLDRTTQSNDSTKQGLLNYEFTGPEVKGTITKYKNRL